MPQSGKLMPHLDQQSTKQLNLTVLQRFDPSIQDILLTAAHVALYEFSMGQNQWSRKDVQGSLFVVKRDKDPWYQFIVMNQRNTENLVENLTGNFEFDVQTPYLLYKNVAQEVNGIWFYNTPECGVVADLFNRIIDSFTRSATEPLESNKSEFNELEYVPSTAVMERPLEPPPASSSAPIHAANVTEISSISNFFNAAANISNTGQPVQTYYTSSEHMASAGSASLRPATSGFHQIPSMATSAPTIHHLIHHKDASDSTYRSNQITNLVTPAIFHTPHPSSSAVSLPTVSSSMPPSVPQPSLAFQRQYGAPFLQPYPPPAPSPFLTPHSAPASSQGPIIDRGKVREALLTLAQDNQFIDMFCKALQQVHQV